MKWVMLFVVGKATLHLITLIRRRSSHPNLQKIVRFYTEHKTDLNISS